VAYVVAHLLSLSAYVTNPCHSNSPTLDYLRDEREKALREQYEGLILLGNLLYVNSF